MKNILYSLIVLIVGGLAGIAIHQALCVDNTKVITLYENCRIPGNAKESNAHYTNVDGYRYANITVEFDQPQDNRPPVSLEIIFAHNLNGKFAAKKYFTVGENLIDDLDLGKTTVTPQDSWHGHPQDKSSYIIRVPVMGPYMCVLPFNHYDFERYVSVGVYLTQ